MKALYSSLIFMFLLGCVNRLNIKSNDSDGMTAWSPMWGEDVSTVFLNVLKRLEESSCPKKFSSKIDQERISVRVIYIPTWGPVLHYRAIKHSQFGPCVISLKVTSGSGGYEWGSVVFDERKIVRLTEFKQIEPYFFSAPVPVADTKLDPPFLDGSIAYVEICMGGNQYLFLRRQPRTIPDDLEALAEQDEGTDDKWSASDELFIRQYLSELMAWFNFQWGME
ncbi:MAG: hypothetical protein JJU05_01690 [Verrucomicrobia bacterium]|nr:hypothetical protein [Verrucomicrobiota bacterium]MCH8529008.1 hypothetical protein [Kiritimatiellia bacterium]